MQSNVAHPSSCPPDADILAVLEIHPQIQLAILFGSVAQGRATPESDLDLAVAAKYPLNTELKTTLIEELAVSIGRPIDLIDLHDVGEPLLGEILAGGRRILGSSELYAALLRKHLFDQADFLPYRNRILAERRRAWIGV